MEKDLGKINKNDNTDIVVRIDDFGGKVGLTIREFISSERYTGFTKAGTRIPANKIEDFKKIINSIDEKEIAKMVQEAASKAPAKTETSATSTAPKSNSESKEEYL
jgi:hypothetical protein